MSVPAATLSPKRLYWLGRAQDAMASAERHRRRKPEGTRHAIHLAALAHRRHEQAQEFVRRANAAS